MNTYNKEQLIVLKAYADAPKDERGFIDPKDRGNKDVVVVKHDGKVDKYLFDNKEDTGSFFHSIYAMQGKQIEDVLTEDIDKEEVCNFRVNFDKKADDFKDFNSEDEAIKFAKDNLKDEPHVFKKCGDKEPEEIASYQDWNYGVREKLDESVTLKDLGQELHTWDEFLNALEERGIKEQNWFYIHDISKGEEDTEVLKSNSFFDRCIKKGYRLFIKGEGENAVLSKLDEDGNVVGYTANDRRVLDDTCLEEYGVREDLEADAKALEEAIESDDEYVEFLKPGFKVPEHQVLIDLFSELKPLYCKATDEYIDTYFGDENDNTHGCEVSFKVEDGNKLKLTVSGNFTGDPVIEKIFDLDHTSPLGILRFIDENRLNVCHANVDKVEEDYTGNPEERTDHLDYVDDNPTDDKFKFPKNITKKEDDHCEKVNPVINHDPDDKKVLKESLAGFSFEKGDSVVDKYEAWADVYVKAQSGGEILITVEGPLPDEVDDCFYLDISGGWSKYDNRDVGLGYDWEFECDGVSVDPGPIDKALNCFDVRLQKLEKGDPVDITVAEVCQILQVSSDTLAVIIADAKKEVLQQFMEDYEDYIYDNINDFVEYDPDDYD